MKNNSDNITLDISGDFSLVHSFVNLENLENLRNKKLCYINNFDYEDVNIDTYYTINYIVKKIENIYEKEIDTLNITVNRAIKLVLQKLRKSLNIGEKLLYQKLEIYHLEKQIEILKQETITDPLTQILNRRGICEEFKKILALKNRNHIDSSVLIIDIDHFKLINDKYGHDVGDVLLMEISKMFKNELRSSDVVGRLGGEEFIIIMYGTELGGAFEKANAIRLKVQENLHNKIKNITNPITISIGVAQTKIEDNSYQELVKKADNALLNAKQNGRNCVKYEL